MNITFRHVLRVWKRHENYTQRFFLIHTQKIIDSKWINYTADEFLRYYSENVDFIRHLCFNNNCYVNHVTA